MDSGFHLGQQMNNITGSHIPVIKLKYISIKLKVTFNFQLKDLIAINLLLVERHRCNLICMPNVEPAQKLNKFLLDNCCGGKSCISVQPL